MFPKPSACNRGADGCSEKGADARQAGAFPQGVRKRSELVGGGSVHAERFGQEGNHAGETDEENDKTGKQENVGRGAPGHPFERQV